MVGIGHAPTIARSSLMVKSTPLDPGTLAPPLPFPRAAITLSSSVSFTRVRSLSASPSIPRPSTSLVHGSTSRRSDVVVFVRSGYQIEQETTTAQGSTSSTTFGHRDTIDRFVTVTAPQASSSSPLEPRPRDRCDPVIDYFTAEGPYLSIELPDDGSQEPDDASDDYYYPKGAYYYVKTTDG
ncbi:uncharacterized protein LOC125541608 [Triticum urartu]|uniref:uncharacterized protein LOC125541608 n=1 Tax=Triticum urartu TaxID=4572 RepID=UPI002044136F|nr:uncharacterized protein LOC125541608 [Triticum urartu]